MSHLAHQKDDHPEAAGKNLRDAQILYAAHRHDGAAYLAGYVVECSLKTHVLLAQCFIEGQVDQQELEKWHRIVSKQLGHSLLKILNETITPNFTRYLRGPTYDAGVSSDDDVFQQWSASMRYWASESTSQTAAFDFLESAARAYHSVLKMKLDGLL